MQLSKKLGSTYGRSLNVYISFSLVLVICFIFSGSINAQSVWSEDFSSLSTGSKWLNVNQTKILSSGGVGNSKCVEVEYDKRSGSSGTTRLQARVPIPRGKEYTLNYDIMFTNDWTISTGGKFHGLIPNNSTTGCAPLENDGWSARVVFRDRKPSSYSYHQNRPGRCGDRRDDNGQLNKNTWYSISLHVKMNSANNVRDGFVRLYVNGDLRTTHDNIEWRSVISNATEINQFFFSTFLGASPSGSVTSRHHIRYDNFSVDTGEAIRSSPGGGASGGSSDDIASVSAPTSVQSGNNVSVNVNYSASTNRDVYVLFQLDQSPWATYAQQKIDVSAGSGTLNFNLNIPSSTPVANNAYQFQTFITTNGGGWNQRLDNITRANVDVTSGGGSSGGDISNGVYRFQNVNTGQYMDADGSNVVRVKGSNGNPDQEWGLHATSGGYYNIDSRFSGRGVLDTDPNGVVKWTTTSPTNFSDGMEWKPIKLSNGNYRFENRIADRKYLRYNGNSSVIGYSDVADSRSEWKLTRVSNLRTGVAAEASITAGIAIYPNPASSSFTVDVSAFEDAIVSVKNVNGQTVGEYKAAGDQLALEASNWDAGVYFIFVVDANGSTASEKLIVE